jgi:3-carboxy-cis,cis-muconate cycloisomerase
MVALAAAQRAPQRVATLLATLLQEHERGLGLWQAELAEWPQLVMSAHGSARAMAKALQGLEVDAGRMRANLENVRVSQPEDVAQTWFAPELARHAGHLAQAQSQRLRASLTAA